jgi:hypothetical protein
MHTVDVKLVPEEKGIYDLFSDTMGRGHMVKCGVKAYVWNASAKAFDRNVQLTKQATRSYCRSSKDCRSSVVERPLALGALPGTLRRECEYDSYADTRELAKLRNTD